MEGAWNGQHIDPHVHCRDFNQAYKATIKGTMDLARSQGVVAICDMPNTDPPLTSRAAIERRIALAESEGVMHGYYMYIGATADTRQLAEAADVVRENPRVVGMKLYAGTSVGSLAVVRKDEQRAIYTELARIGYRGLLAVHCEKEDLIDMHAWDPSRPATWNSARPPAAELESVRDQLELAVTSGFHGTLHIPHISTPEAVELVYSAKKNMHITSGVTPHHLTMSVDDMDGGDGILLKVNPPLRDAERSRKMRECLRAGMIDWIETDHAPHTEQEKRERYLSGIRSLERYSKLMELLAADGFSKEMLRAVTYSNIKEAYPKIRE